MLFYTAAQSEMGKRVLFVIDCNNRHQERHSLYPVYLFTIPNRFGRRKDYNRTRLH